MAENKGPQHHMSEGKQAKLYSAPAVRTPSLSRLADIAGDLGLDLTNEELQQYQEIMSGMFNTTFKKIHELAEPKLPIKYPRITGYRPSKSQNPLNAWYWCCDIQGAASGKLHGKTIAIKDNIPVAGIPMMNGSRILEGYVPDVDATVVTRVLDAGGRILGKSVCEDFCCSDESFSTATGPVLNPLDTTRSAGGSSSGSAALIASGVVDMAIGGDQGGSIRTPAAACGIVGLKPTYGLVPYTAISSIEMSHDHCGPMAKTVHDTALLLEAIAGLDKEGLDPRQPRDMPVQPVYTKRLTGVISGVRIGLLKEGFSSLVEPDVNVMVRRSAERLQQLGAVVEDVSVPWHSLGADLLIPIFVEGGANTMFDRFGGSSGLAYYNTHMQLAVARGLKTHTNDSAPTVKLTRMMARYLKEDYYGVFYSKSQNLRRELTRAYDEALSKYHVLIMPTVPKRTPKIPDGKVSIKEFVHTAFLQTCNTAPFDLSGHPALSINAGSSHGLPVGMMIVGRRFDDAMVLNVAHAYEKLRDQFFS
ncbi:amidase isoform X1 [Nematostella vectensis]|uniref:amidase isoform X1 n=1 Tax=Nematostella vectensis TaxID=45351 RepID=UPI00138FEA9A|nr:amidase isoform X1 [Nematostella vectensis]